HRQAQQVAIYDRSRAKLGLPDGLVDSGDSSFVPNLHGYHARLRDRDRSNLVEWQLLAVNIDHNRIEQIGAGASRSQPAQLPLQGIDGGTHAPFQIADFEIDLSHTTPPAGRGDGRRVSPSPSNTGGRCDGAARILKNRRYPGQWSRGPLRAASSEDYPTPQLRKQLSEDRY